MLDRRAGRASTPTSPRSSRPGCSPVAVPLLVLVVDPRPRPADDARPALHRPDPRPAPGFIGGRTRVDHAAALRRGPLAERVLPRHAPAASPRSRCSVGAASRSTRSATISRRYGDTTMEVLRTAFQTSLVLEWGGAVAVALVAVEISLRLMDGSIAFDRALAVLIIVPEFFLPLRQLATRYHSGAAGRAVAERVVRDPRRARRRAVAGSGARSRRRPSRRRRVAGARPPDGAIRLRRASSSRYPGRTAPALDGLDLTHPAGAAWSRWSARPGAGKSTLASLLLRFIEPDAGAIRVGDTPLAAIDLAAWRARVAWVPQRPHLFHGTVADNIRLARPDADGRGGPAAAAREAGADDVHRDPARAGYDTPVGEGGVAAERRPAPADRDRPGVPDRCPAGHPRRGDLAPRPGQRGRSSATPSARSRATRTVLVVSHRLRLVDDRRPRRRARSRTRRRVRLARRARRSRRAVPPAAGDAARGRARRVTIVPAPVRVDRPAAAAGSRVGAVLGLPRRRVERRPDGDVGLPHLEGRARHERRRGRAGHHRRSGSWRSRGPRSATSSAT